MKCSNCGTLNSDTARFCSNCGSPLDLKCPNCGTPHAPGAKFCQNCGHRLDQAVPPGRAPAPAPSPQAQLDKYIPKELLRRLESARASGGMDRERRIVTILFCDVKGSTAAAESMDPEEWAEIMSAAFEHLIPPVYRYEGTLARLMGDAILAFFGAPIAHEDDPQRAVLAAVEILESIQPFCEQLKRERGLDFAVRVGINTGLVVVGEVGSDLRVEYTAMGDAVNLASRMEQTAEPGTVQISANTHRLIAPLFEFESLGGIEVKGRAEPVQAYRVLRPKAEPGRLRGIEGLHSPMVGREKEFELLRARIEDLLSGQGHIASVMGEAGLGKSRLIAELRERFLGLASAEGDAPAPLWLEGRSLSYQANTPFAPFASLLKGYFGLSEDAPEPDNYRQLSSRLETDLPGQSPEIAPFLAALLGIAPQGVDAERITYLEPPQLREMIFGACVSFFQGLAASRPVVLVFDDLHWADPSTLELLERLLPLADSSMLMLVGVFRPRRQEPSWRFHETAARDFGHRYSQVLLEPLDESQSRQLVANLLHVEDLPERVRRLIMTKAEGNPFYVEEVIRSLLDARLVVRDNAHWRATREIENISLPDTLAGVITARLDRLDEGSKRTAQTASVIGREFPYDSLREVSDLPQTLESALPDLVRRELVREKSRLPRRVYLFKHVLTQETAYNSLLLSKRRELHRRVAECLEKSEPDRVNDIARHFLEAQELVRALPYLVAAGERAAKAYSTQEAIGYFRQALKVLESVDGLALARRAYEGLGGALGLSGDVPGALETYQRMLTLARQRDDGPMQVSALNKVAYVTAMMMGQFPDAAGALEEAEQLAREHDDPAGLYEHHLTRCMMCTAQAEFDQVESTMSEAAEIGQRTQVRAYEVTGLAHVASSQVFMTHFEDAWRTGQEALRAARETGDRFHEADVLADTLPPIHLRNGDVEAARREAEEGVDIARRIGAPMPQVYGLWGLGDLARQQGESETALRHLQGSLEAGRPLEGFMPFMTVQPLGALVLTFLEISPELAGRATQYQEYATKLLENPVASSLGGATPWADLGLSFLILGQVQKAKELFAKGLEQRSMMMHLERPRLLIGAALAAVAEHRLEDAELTLAQARQYIEERGMKNHFPALALAEAQALASREGSEGALRKFGEAEAAALEMGMRPIVWQARAGAAKELELLGRTGEAEAKRAEAQAMVEEIAGLFADEQLRAAFLESAWKRFNDG